MSLRVYRAIDGEVHTRTDQELVEAFLTGYVDPYAGGALEHIQAELTNIREKTAKALLALDHAAIVKLCEEQSE